MWTSIRAIWPVRSNNFRLNADIEGILLHRRRRAVRKSNVDREWPVRQPVDDRHLANGKRQRIGRQLDDLLVTGQIDVGEFGPVLEETLVDATARAEIATDRRGPARPVRLAG